MKKLIVIILAVMSVSPLLAQIKNPNKPLKGNWDFKPKKMWDLDSAGDELLATIQNIEIGHDGRVYMMDPKTFNIHIFSKDGKYISTFGKKGEGPGELRQVSLGHQLYVLENLITFADAGRIHHFTLDGKYIQSYPHALSLRPRAFISEDVFISAPSMVPIGVKGRMSLYNAKTKLNLIFAEYDPFDKAVDMQAGRSIAVDNITPMAFIGTRNEKIYFGVSNKYEITIANAKGRRIRTFSLEGRERKIVSQEYRDNVRRALGAMQPDVADRLVKALPQKASFFDKIVIDKDGLIYIFISSPGSENIRPLDIFSPEGKFLYSAEIKIQEDYSIGAFCLLDDDLVIEVEDEDGNTRVAKYSIKRPSL